MSRVRAIAPLLFVALVGCRPGPLLLGVEEIEPGELAAALRGPRPPLLLDGRDAESYRRGHIPGALRVEIAELAGFFQASALPRGREVVTICYHGNRSLGAAATVRALARGPARSLRGGMARWQELGLPLAPGPGPTLDPAELRPPLLRPGFFAQLAALAARYLLRPLGLLTGLLTLILLRRRGGIGAVLLRRGTVAALVGGAAALGAELRGPSVELELVRGLGMVTWLALAAPGLLHLADPGARSLAGPVPSRGLLVGLALALALLALLPLCAPISRTDFRLEALGAEILLSRGIEAQLVELRLYPVCGAVAFGLAAAVFARSGRPLARGLRPLCAGFAFLACALAHLLVVPLLAAPAWASFWQALAPLLALALSALVVWRAPREAV